ncbi:hypothetical protein NL341_26440, partial [Klebsiella pneumoniae]|nr:hypothetical protein [Klebsiella pneumoniae]
YKEIKKRHIFSCKPIKREAKQFNDKNTPSCLAKLIRLKRHIADTGKVFNFFFFYTVMDKKPVD